MRLGALSTVTSPNFVATFAGKAPSDEPPGEEADAELSESSEEPHAVSPTSRAATAPAMRTGVRRGRRARGALETESFIPLG